MQILAVALAPRPTAEHQTFGNAPWHWAGQLPDPGVPFSAVATGNGNSSYPQVIGLGASNGLPYVTWQDAIGSWYWGGQLPDP